MTPSKPSWWTSDQWETPQPIVDAIAREYGGTFDLDPCCRPETAKAKRFYTAADDGLSHNWAGRVWLNPPFSNPRPWLAKAVEASALGAIVVAILPVRTDTAWFHSLVYGVAEIRMIRGRVRWLGWERTPIPSPKDPSMLAIYGEGRFGIGPCFDLRAVRVSPTQEPKIP